MRNVGLFGLSFEASRLDNAWHFKFGLYGMASSLFVLFLEKISTKVEIILLS